MPILVTTLFCNINIHLFEQSFIVILFSIIICFKLYVWNILCHFLFTDLTRRTCDKLEKDFLREKGVVTETQSDLGKLFSFKCNDSNIIWYFINSTTVRLCHTKTRSIYKIYTIWDITSDKRRDRSISSNSDT